MSATLWFFTLLDKYIQIKTNCLWQMLELKLWLCFVRLYAIGKRSPYACCTVRRYSFNSQICTVVALNLIVYLNLFLSKSVFPAVSNAATSCSVCDCKWTAVPSLNCWWSCSRTRRKPPAPLVRPTAPEAGPASASNLTRVERRAARSTRRQSAARLIYFSSVFSDWFCHVHAPAYCAQSKLMAQN